MALYGLIGKTLKHSFSKQYFTDKFQREGIEASYELFELPEIADFQALLRQYPGISGLNVTIPYKEAVIPFLDYLSPEAERIGAVNTIIPTAKGLEGHNTDVVGFEQSLRESWSGAWPTGALVLGSGGAAKAVTFVLTHKLGIGHVLTVSRHPKGPQEISYDELTQLDWQEYRIVVNTTPLGMYPQVDARPELPYQKFALGHLAFDLTYNPSETAFMAAAASFGANAANGLRMLVLQAEKSWELWNGAGA
ncbi:MAG: shikimate dehydrogenase [Bacteroidia bacterium]|nr:shikimate dehydrogenase [Bacteroidia bacterium]